VPFIDLVTPHRQIEAALTTVFRNALSSAEFVGGPVVERFEQHFAAACGAQHAIGVSSGTDALRFALIAAGVAPGDTVLTVANTFIATVEAICQAGGQPAFVDIDPRTFTLDPARLRHFLEHEHSGSRVSAVVPVHLFGQMAEMDDILEIAADHNLLVVEDACQAHGAKYFSKARQAWCEAGTMGHAAAFSFYPGKNLGACGEAGAVTTNDARIADACRMLRNHGQSRKYIHDVAGYNGRLDAIQAGILDVKLPFLNDWNERRRLVARRYDEAFAEVESVVVPFVPPNLRHVYHLYVVRVAQRDAVQERLKQDGIDTGIHYPIPLHQTPAYADSAFAAGTLHETERAAAEILSLPMFPGLGEDEQRYVIDRAVSAVTSLQLASV